MSGKEEYIYFVSYRTERGWTGRVQTTRTRKIDSIEEVELVEANILKKEGYDVVVTNFILMDKRRVK